MLEKKIPGGILAPMIFGLLFWVVILFAGSIAGWLGDVISAWVNGR